MSYAQKNFVRVRRGFLVASLLNLTRINLRRHVPKDCRAGLHHEEGCLRQLTSSALAVETEDRLGSLCKGLHSEPYAQVATMRRWSVADDADPSVAKRWQGERVKIWT